MSRYIDADLLKKQIEMERILPHDICKSFFICLKYFPTADVQEIKHGNWILFPNAHYFKCDKCRYTVPYKKAHIHLNGEREYNFCPHCGAKMDEEEKSECM